MQRWQLDYKFRETGKLSNFLKIALPIQMILSIVALVVTSLVYPALIRVKTSNGPANKSDLHSLYETSVMLETIGTAMLILGVALAVATLVWVYRKHANVGAMRVEGLKYHPGKAVFMWMLPIVNAITVFFSLRELYRASTSPQDISRGTTSRNFQIFCACLLVMSITQVLRFFPTGYNSIETFTLTGLSMAATAVGLFFLRRIIVEIDRTQSSSLMQLSRERKKARQAAQTA